MTRAVASRTGWALTLPLIALIVTPLRTLEWRVLRLAAQIAAGTYKPRAPSAGPREKASADRPRPAPPKDPLPRKFGWLRPLIPETVAFAGMLDSLLHDPEMVALMAAALEAMGRPIRSICRMLGLQPPAAVALPPRRKPAPRLKREKPPPMPRWPHDPRRRDRFGFYIGPPPMLPYTPRVGCKPPAKKPA